MVDSPEKLSLKARAVCEEQSLVLSAVSVWEIAIKARQGKLLVPGSVGEFVRRQTRIGFISMLPIYFPHAVSAGALKSAHRDPFDRMLAAQCIEERLPFVTKDPFFASCGVETIW